MTARRLLILGGTAEAAALARGASARFGDGLEITTSLAGRTQNPGPLSGQVRIGGFGGPRRLAAYLTEREIHWLIDATHPFAARISSEARIACNLATVPRLLLVRPPWRRHPLDRWIEVDDAAAAAALAGRIGRRVWLTIGAGEIASFSAVDGVHFLVRVIDPPQQPLPLRSYEVVVGRGPFTVPEERRLLEQHAIDVLVCKASGGAATEAKLIAARELGLPVIMLRRPAAEPGEAVDNVAAALDWLADSRRFPRNEEGVMRTRHATIFLLALFGAMAAGGTLHAQFNLFGGYWDNVARAAHQNDANQVRTLIANDGNPNQTDEESRTALHYAATNGNLTITAILIKAKAKLDPKDKLGNTPLHMAAERNQTEEAQLLLDVGAPVDAENKNGMTPLMVAAARGNIEIVQALLAKGASVTKTDFTGRDAAGWAAESHRPAVVQAIKRAQTAKRS